MKTENKKLSLSLLYLSISIALIFYLFLLFFLTEQASKHEAPCDHTCHIPLRAPLTLGLPKFWYFWSTATKCHYLYPNHTCNFSRSTLFCEVKALYCLRIVCTLSEVLIILKMTYSLHLWHFMFSALSVFTIVVVTSYSQLWLPMNGFIHFYLSSQYM